MITRTALALSASLALASLGVSAQTTVDGDVETAGDGYINVGGLVLKTGLGECLQTGTNSEDNLINKCEGIDDEATADADAADKAAQEVADAAKEAEAAAAEVAKAPATPQQTAKIDTRQFSEQALFDTDSADLNSAGQAMMTSLFGELSEYKGITSIMVVGHTDSIGSEAYNQALSERRAATVASEITGQYPGANIEVKGMGESQPVASNDNDAGRQLNRRVEIEITATRMIFN